MTDAQQAGRTLVQSLADFADQLELDTIPVDVVDEARRCVMDTLGVIAAGQQSDVANTTFAYASQAYAPGRARMPGRESGLQAAGAALVNACAGHAFDFDDTSYTGIMHGSVAVLPAALALAEQQQLDGAALLQAFIAGVEIEYAVAEFCTTQLYFKGWWTTGLYATLGAAAASAKLLGLGPAGIESALSLAMCNANGMKAAFGSDAKPLGVGLAASRGIDCALLAQAGLSGPLDVFESDSGFLSLYNDNCQLNDSSLQLFQRWRLLEPGILFKSYPVCSAAQAATELCAGMLESNELQASSIARVDCDVTELVRISLVYDDPESIRQAQFSLPFSIGCILTYGELGLPQLAPQVLHDAALREQMAKVSMRVPDYLVNDETVSERCPEGAGLRLTMTDGREFERFLERPCGMSGNPLSDAMLEAKAQACLIYGGYSEDQARRLCERLWQLETVSDLSQLSY